MNEKAVLTAPKHLRKVRLGSVLIHLFMIFILLIILIPVLNLVAKTVSDPVKVSMMNGWQIWPSGFSLINYRIILSNDTFWQSLINSVVITVTGTLISVLLTSSAAYVLTRPNLPGKQAIMVFLIVAMIVEPTIIQEYFVMKDFGILNKLWCMILYNSVNIYYLIVLMRFFSDTPQPIMEAAKIDGANELQTLFRVFLPVNRVPIITIGMFYAVIKWNEYYRSSVFLTAQGKMVVQVFLRKFVVDGETSYIFTGQGFLFNSIADLSLSALKDAAIVVSVIPILLLYPIILKYFTSGVLSGSVKE